MPHESPDRCAPSAERRGDSRIATAAPAQRFLLIERPGPWPARLVLDVLAPEIRPSLASATAALEARLLLVRRVGRAQTGGPRRWFLADVRPGHEQIRWGEVPDERHLADVDFAAARENLAGLGQEWERPLYLVCTHGRHDVCCAVRGRPIARALQALLPDDVWECSHVGGDRFAANLVTLPGGLYYGGVGVGDVPELVELTRAGRTRLELLRGRSAWRPAAQAAAWWWWHERGELTPDPNGVAVLSVERIGAARSRVRLATEDGETDVVVESRRDPQAHRLTCAALQPAHATSWHLVGIEPLARLREA
ncbi:MAG: sucrase ferredoxin [Actinomycetales bacterium]